MENVALETVTLKRAVEVVRALTPGEQQQLRRLMDSWQVPQPPTTLEQEQRFAQHLLKIGMIDQILAGCPEGYVDPPPIVVLGEPVSETIIRERR